MPALTTIKEAESFQKAASTVMRAFVPERGLLKVGKRTQTLPLLFVTCRNTSSKFGFSFEFAISLFSRLSENEVTIIKVALDGIF